MAFAFGNGFIGNFFGFYRWILTWPTYHLLNTFCVLAYIYLIFLCLLLFV